jgi:hypothetical protein
MHNELLSAQETIRILRKEVSEKESEVTTDTLTVCQLTRKVLLVSRIRFATVKFSFVEFRTVFSPLYRLLSAMHISQN